MSLKKQLQQFPDVFAKNVGKSEAFQATFRAIGEVIARQFTESVAAASLEEIVELRGTGGGRRRKPRRNGRKGGKRTKRAAAKTVRLPRRSAAQIARAGDRVARLLKKNPEGLRSEGIRAALRIEARALPRVLRDAVTAKKIVVLSGAKRSTTYGAVARTRVRARKAAKKAVAVKKTAAAKNAKKK